MQPCPLCLKLWRLKVWSSLFYVQTSNYTLEPLADLPAGELRSSIISLMAWCICQMHAASFEFVTLCCKPLRQESYLHSFLCYRFWTRSRGGSWRPTSGKLLLLRQRVQYMIRTASTCQRRTRPMWGNDIMGMHCMWYQSSKMLLMIIICVEELQNKLLRCCRLLILRMDAKNCRCHP